MNNVFFRNLKTCGSQPNTPSMYALAKRRSWKCHASQGWPAADHPPGGRMGRMMLFCWANSSLREDSPLLVAKFPVNPSAISKAGTLRSNFSSARLNSTALWCGPGNCLLGSFGSKWENWTNLHVENVGIQSISTTNQIQYLLYKYINVFTPNIASSTEKTVSATFPFHCPKMNTDTHTISSIWKFLWMLISLPCFAVAEHEQYHIFYIYISRFIHVLFNFFFPLQNQC